MRVHCQDWTLDTTTRQIVRGGRSVHVSPKAFDVLTILLLERPRAVSKADLLVRVWPDVFISEATLVSLIAEVRSALGDEARSPRYVRTVHRHGYAFCGAAREDRERPLTSSCTSSSARLVLGEREIGLVPGHNVLGRIPEVSVWIESASVSRCHARITVSEGAASLEDLGSKNGTFLNGVRVRHVQPLSDRDEIRLGRVRMVFRSFAASPSTETEAE